MEAEGEMSFWIFADKHPFLLFVLAWMLLFSINHTVNRLTGDRGEDDE